MNYDKLLENKKCVITSGAHGMGFAIAKLFAKHGAKVAICGHSSSGEKSAEILRQYNPDCFFVKCDMGNLDEVKAFAQKVIEKFGYADVLVNNVGINRKELVKDISEENYNYVMNVNLNSAVLLTKMLIPPMLENNVKGSIINISSMNSIAPSPTTGSYSSSKGGMNSFTKVLAVELGKYSIRANAICPGWVATSYIKKDIEDLGGDEDAAFKVLEELNGSAPLLSPARATDIANHALYLASDMSSYVTGYIMYSDGAAIMQAHTCDFPEPDDALEMRKQYYNTIVEDLNEL